MNWEWSIRAGDILTMGGALIVAGGILYHRGRDESRLEDTVKMAIEEISEMKQELKSLGVLVAKIAVQETKIDLLMKWYDELRRGVGLVVKPPPDAK